MEEIRKMNKKILPYIIAGGVSLFGASVGNSTDVEVDPYVDYLNLKELYVQEQNSLKVCESEYAVLETKFEESVQHYNTLLNEYQVMVKEMDLTIEVLQDSLNSLEQKLLIESGLKEKAENKKFLGIF